MPPGARGAAEKKLDVAAKAFVPTAPPAAVAAAAGPPPPGLSMAPVASGSELKVDAPVFVPPPAAPALAVPPHVEARDDTWENDSDEGGA